MEHIIVKCAICKEPIKVKNGKRAHHKRYCGNQCREQAKINESNDRWFSKKGEKIPHSKKKDKHPWLG